MPALLQPRYTEFMNRNSLIQNAFSCGKIRGGFTRRDIDAPEYGNTALHICISPEDVMINRNAIAQETLPLESWVLAGQKHTNHIVRVTKADRSKGAFDAQTAFQNTDGLYTTDPDVLIGVFTADCIGMLLYDPTIPLVAAVHSGWKGTVQAILSVLLKELQSQNLLHPESLQIRFSPSLMKDSFEVGPEVVSALQEMAKKENSSIDDAFFEGEGDRSFVDHQLIQKKILEAYGIPEENMHFSDQDTKTSPDCFSYRRDGRLCGEHFSWICIDPDQQTD